MDHPAEQHEPERAGQHELHDGSHEPPLDQLSEVEIVSNPSILVASRAFDETFLRSSKIGRRGDE